MMDLPHDRQQMGSPVGLHHRLVNQEFQLQNEYLIAENRILRARLPARMRLSDPQPPPSLRSASDSVALPLSRSPVSPSQIPSSPGIGDSLPANSTAPNSALHHRAVPASRPKWRHSLSASQKTTPAGVTTASSKFWPISATPSPIRRWATSSAGTGSNRHRDEAKYHLEDFIASHLAVLAGTDLFTVEVLTWRGLGPYYSLFFISMAYGDAAPYSLMEFLCSMKGEVVGLFFLRSEFGLQKGKARDCGPGSLLIYEAEDVRPHACRLVESSEVPSQGKGETFDPFGSLAKPVAG